MENRNLIVLNGSKPTLDVNSLVQLSATTYYPYSWGDWTLIKTFESSIAIGSANYMDTMVMALPTEAISRRYFISPPTYATSKSVVDASTELFDSPVEYNVVRSSSRVSRNPDIFLCPEQLLTNRVEGALAGFCINSGLPLIAGSNSSRYMLVIPTEKSGEYLKYPTCKSAAQGNDIYLFVVRGSDGTNYPPNYILTHIYKGTGLTFTSYKYVTLTWEGKTFETTPYNSANYTRYMVYSEIAFVNNQFIFIYDDVTDTGTTCICQTSPNGTTWTQKANTPFSPSYTRFNGMPVGDKILYVNGNYIIMKNDGVYATSSDLDSWTIHEQIYDYNSGTTYRSRVILDQLYVSIYETGGTHSLYSTYDCINWTKEMENVLLRDFVFNEDRIMAFSAVQMPDNTYDIKFYQKLLI